MVPSRRLCTVAIVGAFLIVLMVISRFGTLAPASNALTSEQMAFSVRSIPVPTRAPQRAEAKDEGKAAAGRVTATDNTKAQYFLKKYRELYAQNANYIPMADANRPWTVKYWWQAAAIIDWYFQSDLRYNCKARREFGNWAVCMDPPYTVKPPCLVYSFGIANDFSFDDAIAAHGCEVHSFDPSMNLEDHKRRNKSYFYNLGLSHQNTDAHQALIDHYYVKEPQEWKVRTLTSIKEMLGHQGRVVDVLKMDIEASEWAVLDNLIETGELKNVRHFSLEFHLFPKRPPQKDYIHFYKAFTKLREDLGFLEHSVAPHPANYLKEQYNIQGDSQFVNSLFPYPSS